MTRSFASATGAKVSGQKTNTKPKPNQSSTSLKRTASASLPIRENPNPTRGCIHPVLAFATAERFNLGELFKALTPSAKRFEDAIWVPTNEPGGSQGEVWIFGNGAIVCWGLDEESARTFAQHITLRTPHAIILPLREFETEELEFVTDPAERTRLQGDLIILGQVPPYAGLSEIPSHPDSTAESSYPTRTFPARYAFSQALARSTALAAFESRLDAFISSVERLPQTLSETGVPGLKRKEIIRKLGELLKFRQGLNLSRQNFGDTPDFYWAEPVLEEYFNSMSKALDIHERVNALNQKITYAAEVQVTLRELLTESSTHRMELIIIALIAVEAAIAVIRDGPELWHIFFPPEERNTLEPSVSTLPPTQ
ncbi:uncharacterized protein EI90DRAFT_3116981 [Cantharellus anzutake]|uniref:uncharacterized protein n=1 Tax=Cantharellus anzutake TaxID=1750568 RepID=UPI001908877A|nr:uncharacterized protein EI90DRAFT_3116981 [Cantharellus anzutake]KAF8340426.1 hypothetical protein EI90DRAFT_3116981 [Cantharellus anzutake]